MKKGKRFKEKEKKFKKKEKRFNKKKLKNTKKLSVKKLMLWVVLILVIGIMVFSAYQLLSLEKDNKVVEKIIEDVICEVEEVEIPDNENTIVVKQETHTDDQKRLFEKYSNMSLTNVDFSKLMKVNNDTKAWVKVKGTNINLPIVQSKDNDYYLYRDFKKDNNRLGWAFADYRNDMSTIDKNTILYGHNVGNNAIFGDLEKVIESEWLNNEDNHIINMSTDFHDSLWTVFSVYVVDNTDDYIKTKFSEKEYSEFLDLIKERSIKDFNTALNDKDKVLTLSTCTMDGKDRRIVLHAKLTKYEKITK